MKLERIRLSTITNAILFTSILVLSLFADLRVLSYISLIIGLLYVLVSGWYQHQKQSFLYDFIIGIILFMVVLSINANNGLTNMELYVGTACIVGIIMLVLTSLYDEFFHNRFNLKNKNLKFKQGKHKPEIIQHTKDYKIKDVIFRFTRPEEKYQNVLDYFQENNLDILKEDETFVCNIQELIKKKLKKEESPYYNDIFFNVRYIEGNKVRINGYLIILIFDIKKMKIIEWRPNR